MRKSLLLATVALVMALGAGCEVQKNSWSYSNRINDIFNSETSKSLNVSNNSPEIAEVHTKNEVVYSYPSKYDDIKKIYSALSLNKKDEFTPTSDFMDNFKPIIEKIMQNKEYLIFKAVPYKTHANTYYPEINYNADTKKLTLYPHIGEGPSFNKVWGNSVLIISNTKFSRNVGYNSFGMGQSYTKETGIEYGIFFINKTNLFIDNIVLGNVSPDQARQLKKNLEVFFVVTLYGDDNLPYIYEANDFMSPKMGNFYACNITHKCIVTKLKAVLFCNKKTKEVILTAYF